MIASVLQEANLKTGLFTGPHLKDFRERIKINGTKISKKFIIKFINKKKDYIESNNLDFYSIMFILALSYFNKKRIDVGVIEAFIGGRDDITNIVKPDISVITNIGLDHVKLLGNNRGEIALHKGGIIKLNTPVIIGETHKETDPVFNKISKNLNSPIYYADKLISITLESDLRGNYQEKNIRTVYQSILILKKLKYNISDTNIKCGLLKTVNNTGLCGRWQTISTKPKIICDVGHNYEAMEYIVEQLKNETFENLHIVIGFSKDKIIDNYVNILPKNANYYFCKSNNHKALETETIEKIFNGYNFNFKTYKTVTDAYQTALFNAKEEDLIFVGGSNYIVAEIL